MDVMASNAKKKRACIVVLGDWGRSPRMQYHALSLAKNGFIVDVIAYDGASPHEAVRNNSFITPSYLRKVPKFENFCSKLLTYMLKTLWQGLFLFTALFHVAKPDVMLLQNPPSVPTLPICWLVCYLRRIKFVIDYHNYGYTILALSAGKHHLLVKLYRWCEKYFGRKAAHCFCVSEALQEDLAVNWKIDSTVFYDCPPEIFHPIGLEEKHDLFLRLSRKHSIFKASSEHENNPKEEYTRFTVRSTNGVMLRDDRPPLIISSTSWTEDEDFSILLKALQEYEVVADLNMTYPNLLVVITGKGPLKTMYERIIEKKDFQHVEIVTLWLDAEDYPTILACSDLGVSLHCSSSSLDLPMKVVDMFGSGLPVCAFYYPCIEELVKEGVNGHLFRNSTQLSSHLQALFYSFPHNTRELRSYRENLETSPLPRWDVSWNEHILPVINDLAR